MIMFLYLKVKLNLRLLIFFINSFKCSFFLRNEDIKLLIEYIFDINIFIDINIY